MKVEEAIQALVCLEIGSQESEEAAWTAEAGTPPLELFGGCFRSGYMRRGSAWHRGLACDRYRVRSVLSGQKRPHATERYHRIQLMRGILKPRRL
jgi:hypothetical protein